VRSGKARLGKVTFGKVTVLTTAQATESVEKVKKAL